MNNFSYIRIKMEDLNYSFTKDELINAINSSRLIPCNADSVMREVRMSGLVTYDKVLKKYVRKNSVN